MTQHQRAAGGIADRDEFKSDPILAGERQFVAPRSHGFLPTQCSENPCCRKGSQTCVGRSGTTVENLLRSGGSRA
jgi:hypothetical protein